MLDGARAVRYVRSHAAELGVAKDRIGLWGFSAGGHLAGYLAAVHDDGEASRGGPDRPGERPARLCDCVLWAVQHGRVDSANDEHGGAAGRPSDAERCWMQISVVKLVTKDTSPCFIYSTTADQTVNSMNATAFYDALKRAGVPVELHIFERGPHGTGMAQGAEGPARAGDLSDAAGELDGDAWMDGAGLRLPGSVSLSTRD